MNRLKYLRTEKGENLEKVAEYLNVSIQTISNYENEKRDMTPDTIIKLAKYFGVSTDYLLGKSDIRNPEEFKYAYNRPKEADGLSDEEVNDALRLYKKMKKQFGGDNKNEIK